jgi:ribosome-binding factor A
MRHVPELRFLHDTASESGQRIEQLLAAARKSKS